MPLIVTCDGLISTRWPEINDLGSAPNGAEVPTINRSDQCNNRKHPSETEMRQDGLEEDEINRK